MPDGSAYLGGGIGLGPVPPPAPREPYPVPEIPAHITDDYMGKRAVLMTVALARSLGWDVVVTRARGCWPHRTTGAPGPQRDSLAVRMRRDGIPAAAVYVQGTSTWAWETLMVGMIKYPTMKLFQEAIK